MSARAELRLGFVPLNDAAPLVVAVEQGFFKQEGLSVRLSREVSWATLRDKIAANALDGAHMLAPIALAGAPGPGGLARPMIAPLALNRGGATFTLARTLTERFGAEPTALALKRHIAERRDRGERPPVLAVVFPYSMHNYVLRYWLAAAGIDPDLDVHITVVPPSRTAARLAAGELDGFCAGEPWNAVAETQGVGEVAMRADDVWRDGPEKIFGVREDWAAENPEILQACLRALLRAAAWADEPANRAELAALMAQPDYVDAPAECIAASLSATTFHARRANEPLPAQAGWLLSQMIRWGHAPREIDVPALARRVFRPDLYNLAAAAVGLPAASDTGEARGFADGGVFRLEDATAYAEGFALGRARTVSPN